MLHVVRDDVPIAPQALPSHSARLSRKILERTAVVGVVGVGYVGLPLAVEKAKVGFTVIGFDRNLQRVAAVNRGKNYIRDVADEDLSAMVSAQKFSATTDFKRLRECDVIVICVPTPLTVNKDPDISYIRNVGEQISHSLREGQLISLESTTYPGTTEEVLLPILAASGFQVGRDYFLAFSPERVDPGNLRYSTRNTNKVVGGMTPACLDVAMMFYKQTILNVLPVSSPRVAEMTKVFENTFRAVNIALVNELALLCDRMDINIWEVIDAAGTKPFGLMRFEPGPGVGGHCIPLDPFYLAWKARQYDFKTRFIELAGEINTSMPHFVREKIIRTLNDDGKAVKNSNLLVCGIAYKKDIEDWRESAALKLIDLLEKDGARVTYHDPHVPSFSHNAIRFSVDLDAASLSRADCVIITTDHSSIDWDFVVRHSKRVIDTRNATRDVRANREKIVLL